MISLLGLPRFCHLDLPKSTLVRIEHSADLRLKFGLFDRRGIPTRVLEIAAFAFEWFCQPSCFQKIYLTDCGIIAYGKNGPVRPEDRCKLELSHSIRKLNSSSFIFTVDRKHPSTLIGEGTYKKVKMAWLIHFDASNRISMSQIVCAKDKSEMKNRFFTNYLDLLDKDLRGIEFQEVYLHETSKGTYKKFHHSPLALYDALNLPLLPKPPNFSQLASILLDLSMGAMNLLSYNLVHGDLKPSNILIYFKDGKYSAKLCDLNSICKFGDCLKEQNLKYLSPIHKLHLFAKIIKTRLSPSSDEIKKAFLEGLKSGFFKASYETMLQSLGLVFADIALSLPNSKGNPEERDIFWRMIFDLTGFKPDSEASTSIEFHEKIDRNILGMARESMPHWGLRITMREVMEKLTQFASQKRPIQIPLEEAYETGEDFLMRIEGGRYPKKALELKYIHDLLPQLFKHATYTCAKKIYFDRLGAYIKQASGEDNPHFSNSIKCLSEGKWIVILNRKSKTTLEMEDSSIKKKYGWKITSFRPNQFVAEQVLICTNINAKIKSCNRWAMERLRDLTCVECPGERFSFQTSDHYIKQLHIAPPSGINSLDFAQSQDKIAFSQFLQICSDTLTGIAELHENDLIYGNLKPNKIVIFNNPISGDYSAKISASSTCIPVGNICSNATLDYLSPRIRQLIKAEVSKSIHNPTDEQIRDKYIHDPSSFNIIITPEDETITAGIILSHLALIMKNTLSSATSEKRDHFWRIISSLTGGLTIPSSFESGMIFFQNLTRQIVNPSRTGPPRAPTISLRAAAAEIKSICI